MTTTTIATGTLYQADGQTISKLYANLKGGDLVCTDDWVPHFWFDQTYGVLVDLVRRTVSIVMPATLKQWRLTGVI